MNLIDAIKSDLVTEGASLSNTIRKAKLLAAQIKSKELEIWINNESNGYKNDEDVPDYRKTAAMNLGRFHGSFGSSIDNQPLPTFNLPKGVKEYATSMVFYQGIKGLEELVKNNDSGKLFRKWPPEAVLLAREHIHMDGDYVLVDAWQPISVYTVEGIIDTIKNRLLDFVIKIEETGNYHPDGYSSEQIKPEEVKNIFNITIEGNNATVASGNNVHQHIENNIKVGDLETLKKFLKENNVEESYIDELQDAIKKDEKVNDSKIGNNVKTWIGKMTSKAIDGSWKIGVQSAALIINEAIKQYYGWE